ncbi:MAG: hypothetical protein WC876_08625 [Candidatus Thermoplasmatota archaeon]
MLLKKRPVPVFFLIHSRSVGFTVTEILGRYLSGGEARFGLVAPVLITLHQTSDLVLRLHQSSVFCMAAAKRSERRVRITVSIAPSLLRWIEGQVGMGKRYRSVAQAVEDAVVFYKDHQPANR